MWSIGIVLYNMVKGTQPFSNGEIENVKDQVLHKDINYFGFKNNALKDLCQSLLERDPEKRYSAFQAINQLKLIKTDIQKLKILFLPTLNLIYIESCLFYIMIEQLLRN